MNSQMVVAKRYAKALFELSSEKEQVDIVSDQLKSLVDAIETNKELAEFLESPNIAKNAKIDVIRQLLGEDVSVYLYNTIRLLIDRDRTTIFPDLFRAFVSIADEALGRAKAWVTSAHELSDKEIQNVANTFSKITGKQIEVHVTVDEGLLGGMQVRIGDRLYDGSLKGKLKRLEKQLIG